MAQSNEDEPRSPLDARVHDQARAGRPDRGGNGPLEVGSDDHIRLDPFERSLHVGLIGNRRDGHVISRVP